MEAALNDFDVTSVVCSEWRAPFKHFSKASLGAVITRIMDSNTVSLGRYLIPPDGFRWLEEGLAASAQPRLCTFKFLAETGFRTIVYLDAEIPPVLSAFAFEHGVTTIAVAVDADEPAGSLAPLFAAATPANHAPVLICSASDSLLHVRYVQTALRIAQGWSFHVALRSFGGPDKPPSPTLLRLAARPAVTITLPPGRLAPWAEKLVRIRRESSVCIDQPAAVSGCDGREAGAVVPEPVPPAPTAASRVCAGMFLVSLGDTTVDRLDLAL